MWSAVEPMRISVRDPGSVQKLSPEVTDIVSVARACVSSGADGLSLVNAVPGMAIDPVSFRRAQERLDRDGLEVIGVYHSHPDHPPAPSAFDRDHAWPWLSYVIVGVGAGRAGDLKSWVLADDRGVFDEESITIEERNAVWQ